ncbi:hypothetical protein KUV51_07700 [Tateyamaria omphalii]|uniref:hypothetical protein n=1 Tax=Tateyamaria omphalii TaxID=299262 RepID=UPI001C99A774|nr:hypothetical protein [Tateyamaria omphalii]MBY5932875.1 hypothetical protein [Tateyamaria omphalii]
MFVIVDLDATMSPVPEDLFRACRTIHHFAVTLGESSSDMKRPENGDPHNENHHENHDNAQQRCQTAHNDGQVEVDCNDHNEGGGGHGVAGGC